MGGRLWIEEEEVVFWEEIAILAPPGHCNTSQRAKSHAEIEKSWEPLAVMMRQKMTSRLQPGKELRRIYTATSCYEHYFQNYVKKKLSPNAKPYVEAYVKRLKEEAKNEQDDIQSSAASTPGGPNSARPKRAAASRKRKATTQPSGRREEGVNKEDIGHMSPNFSQIVREQRATIGVPFLSGDSSYGLQCLMSPLPNSNLAAPSNNRSSISSNPQCREQETFAGFSPMSTMPASQSHAVVPSPMPAAQNNHGFGVYGGFSYPTDFPQSSPAVPTSTDQVNPEFLNPEMQQLYRMGIMTSQAPPPQSTYHPQYQENHFGSMQNNTMDAFFDRNRTDNHGSDNAQNGGMGNSDAYMSFPIPEVTLDLEGFAEWFDSPEFKETFGSGVPDVGMANNSHHLQQEEQSFLDAQHVRGDGNGNGGSYAKPNAQNGGMESSHHQKKKRKKNNEQLAGSAAGAHGNGDGNGSGVRHGESDVQNNNGMISDQQAQNIIDKSEAEPIAREPAKEPGDGCAPTGLDGPPQTPGPGPVLETTTAPDQWRHDFNAWMSGLWDWGDNSATGGDSQHGGGVTDSKQQ